MKKLSCFLLVLFFGLILTGCHSHSYQEKVIEATCTTQGYTEYTCECGDSYKDKFVDAKDHTYGEWKVVKEATETEEGLKEKECTACGDKVSEVIAKLSHTHNYTETVVDATCTEKGYKEYTCTCGDTYKEEIEAKGHTEVEVAGKEATCTEAGLTAGKKCSVCGEVLVAQEEIAALGHTEVEVAAVEATCTEAGLTAGKKCSVCDEVLVAQEEVAALGHTEVEVAGKEATCTETGLTAGKKCSVCDEVLVAQEEIAALGHTEKVEIEGVEPTCTEGGKSDKIVCEVCNEVLQEQEDLLALNHDPKEEVAAVEATCTEKGSTAKLVCDRCGEVLQEAEEIEALGHTEETVPGKDATCSEPGLTEGTKCSVCGEVLKAQEEITAAHTLVYYLGQAATCEEPGYNDHSECTVCGWTDYKEIPAGAHKYGEWVVVKEATAGKNGQQMRTCEICGESLVAVIPADSVLLYQKRTDGTFEVVGILDTFKGGEVVIPSTNEDIAVTSIASYAFQGCVSMTAISIPNTISYVGGYAFAGCTNLMIYCEVDEQPAGWDANWNASDCPVIWGEGALEEVDPNQQFAITFDANGGYLPSYLQAFADEMVELFNNVPDTIGGDSKKTTTQNEFTNTTHPNIKAVFNQSSNLVKYKWFLEFVLETMTEVCKEGGYLKDGYYTNTKGMLEKMIAGDTTAIGNVAYADGRTCLRQYIYRLINVNNPNASSTYGMYNPVTVDFENDIEKLNEFLALLPDYGKATLKNSDILPTPVYPGFYFEGWYDSNNVKVIRAMKDETLTAKWTSVLVKDFNVQFVLEGGSFSGNTEVTGIYKGSDDLPTPFKTHYTFEGWFDNNGNKVEHVIADCKLTAKWTPTKYAVTLKANGGSFGGTYTNIDDFADKFLADFNTYGECSATKTSFMIDSSKPVKKALANSEMLTKYQWFFEYMYEDLQATNPDVTSSYLVDAYPVLEKIIAGNTSAIEDSGNARTMIRSYIHAIMNKTKGAPGYDYDAFAKYTPDFADAAVISAFENAFPGSEQTVSLSIEDTLPTLSREGYKFMGWSDGTSIVEGVTGPCTLTAQWREIKTYEVTASEALTEAGKLAEGEISVDYYTVTGTVKSIDTAYNSTYKNISFYLSDGTKNILCYRASGDEAANVSVGDKITLTGNLKNHYGTLEIVNGVISERIEGVAPETPESPSDALATMTFDNAENRIVFGDDQQVWSMNGATLTNNRNSASKCAKYENPARFYKNSELVFECTSSFKKLVITTSGGSKYCYTGSEALTGATLSVDGNIMTITLDSSATSYTIASLAVQLRISSIEFFAE